MRFAAISQQIITLQMFVVGLFGKEYEPTAYRYNAVIELKYIDPVNGNDRSVSREMGVYGEYVRVFDDASGYVVHVLTVDKKHDGCSTIENAPLRKNWIALIERGGGCRFSKKIKNAIARNASAVVVYNSSLNSELVYMDLDKAGKIFSL